MARREKKIDVWLVRHGESEVNRLDGSRFSGSNLWSELTEEGRQQALQLGQKWRDFRFTHWICSPAVRAQQTCRYCTQGMAPASNSDPALLNPIVWPTYELAPALVEQSQGAAEGRFKKEFEYRALDESTGKIRTLVSRDSDDLWWRAKPFLKSENRCVQDAESQQHVFQRASTFLEKKLSNLFKIWQPDMRVVIFTHETVIKCLCSKLLADALPFRHMSIDHTTAIKLSYADAWNFVDIEGNARIC